MITLKKYIRIKTNVLKIPKLKQTIVQITGTKTDILRSKETKMNQTSRV